MSCNFNGYLLVEHIGFALRSHGFSYSNSFLTSNSCCPTLLTVLLPPPILLHLVTTTIGCGYPKQIFNPFAAFPLPYLPFALCPLPFGICVFAVCNRFNCNALLMDFACTSIGIGRQHTTEGQPLT